MAYLRRGDGDVRSLRQHRSITRYSWTCCEGVRQFSNPSQKKEYLPQMISGKKFAGFLANRAWRWL